MGLRGDPRPPVRGEAHLPQGRHCPALPGGGKGWRHVRPRASRPKEAGPPRTAAARPVRAGGKMCGRGPGAAPHPRLASLREGQLSSFEGGINLCLPGQRVLLQRQISPPDWRTKDTVYMSVWARAKDKKRHSASLHNSGEWAQCLGQMVAPTPPLWPSRAAHAAPTRSCPRLFVFPAPCRRQEQPHTEPFGDEECLIVREGLIKGERWHIWEGALLRPCAQYERAAWWLESRASEFPGVHEKGENGTGSSGRQGTFSGVSLLCAELRLSAVLGPCRSPLCGTVVLGAIQSKHPGTAASRAERKEGFPAIHSLHLHAF